MTGPGRQRYQPRPPGLPCKPYRCERCDALREPEDLRWHPYAGAWACKACTRRYARLASIGCLWETMTTLQFELAIHAWLSSERRSAS